MTAPYRGTRDELIEVLELTGAGLLEVHTETYGLDQALVAYQRLRDGNVNGRAVDPPHGVP